MRRVRSRADVNSAIDNHAQRRTRAGSSGQIFKRMNGDARAQSFEAIHGLLIDVRHVRDGPSQIRDRRNGIHLFERRRR